MFNSNTGKQSIATIAFNNDGWGHALRSFTASAIKKAQSISKFEIIERAAKEFCKGNTHVLESLITEALEDPLMIMMNGQTLQITTVMMTESNECM